MGSSVYKILCFALIWIRISFQDCHGSSSEERLYKLMMEKYSTHARPVRKTGETLTVRFGFSLLEVLGLNEEDGHVSTRAWFKLIWRDENLQWNPAKHNGITKMFFTPNEIWTPDITLFNGIETKLDRSLKAVVFSDGEVNWIPPAILKSTCRHEFRGNHWTCHYNFGSWVYDGRLLNIVPFEKEMDVDVSNYARSDQWYLVDHSGEREVKKFECCPEEPYVSMEYVVKLRKKLGPSLLGKRK